MAVGVCARPGAPNWLRTARRWTLVIMSAGLFFFPLSMKYVLLPNDIRT